MRNAPSNLLDRRKFMEAGAALGLAALGCGKAETVTPLDGAVGGAEAMANGGAEANGGAPTMANGGAPPDGLACPSTSEDIVGPYFKPESPERSVLFVADDPGVRLRLSGRVLNSDCQAIRNAVLDFWQANDAGEYDTEGFAFRGHLKVAQDGSYSLETIIPGRYLNGATYRPAHIHVKVYVGTEVRLITQLYFEGDPYNDGDPWYEPSRALALEEAPDGKQASFDFAV